MYRFLKSLQHFGDELYTSWQGGTDPLSYHDAIMTKTALQKLLSLAMVVGNVVTYTGECDKTSGEIWIVKPFWKIRAFLNIWKVMNKV